MKYTIMGFLQSKLKELGLDTADALILRYFVDFGESNAMKVLIKDNRVYYWVQYDAVIKELPILKMKKCTIQSRFFKLRDAGVLTHYTKKEGGTFSFFGMGERYGELIGEYKPQDQGYEEKEITVPCEGEVPFASLQADEGDTYISQEEHSVQPIEDDLYPREEKLYPLKESQEGCGDEPLTKNPSTKDPSLINPLTPSGKEGAKAEGEFLRGVIDYLNKATGKNFKTSTKATATRIKARRREGFNLNDFKTVIDNMVYQWKGTRFQQYLAPSTLFGTKFETYLQCGKIKSNLETEKHHSFQGKGPLVIKRGNVGALREEGFKDNYTAAEASGELREKPGVNFDLKEDM